MRLDTSAAIIHPKVASMDLPAIHRVPMSRPWYWLMAGAQDMKQSWQLSLFYGLLFALVGYGLVQGAWGRPHLAMTLTSGFLLVAPVLATVFYCVSHRLEHHHKLPSLFVPLLAWRANPASLGLYALMLIFILSVWERLSAILVGLFLNSSGIGSLGDLLRIESLIRHADFAVAYLAFGGMLALLVFSLSVVSLPMLLHRKVDIATAVVTSFLAARLNGPAMLVWAALITTLVVVGFITQFVAMVLIFPLLGHASWHAYRELVERE